MEQYNLTRTLLKQKDYWRKKAKMAEWLRETGEHLFELLDLAERDFEDLARRIFHLIKNHGRLEGKEEQMGKIMKKYYDFLIERREKKYRKFFGALDNNASRK
jgi:uncharacterized C2H2 Zn-finger protein